MVAHRSAVKLVHLTLARRLSGIQFYGAIKHIFFCCQETTFVETGLDKQDHGNYTAFGRCTSQTAAATISYDASGRTWC